jgi:hypothetical protein
MRLSGILLFHCLFLLVEATVPVQTLSQKSVLKRYSAMMLLALENHEARVELGPWLQAVVWYVVWIAVAVIESAFVAAALLEAISTTTRTAAPVRSLGKEYFFFRYF